MMSVVMQSGFALFLERFLAWTKLTQKLFHLSDVVSVVEIKMDRSLMSVSQFETANAAVVRLLVRMLRLKMLANFRESDISKVTFEALINIFVSEKSLIHRVYHCHVILEIVLGNM